MQGQWAKWVGLPTGRLQPGGDATENFLVDTGRRTEDIDRRVEEKKGEGREEKGEYQGNSQQQNYPDEIP